MTVSDAAPKRALVTGAARRLGRAMALALAERGHDLAVHYAGSRDEAETTVAEIEAMGRKALSMAPGDNRTQSSAWQLIADSLRARGKNPQAQEALDRSKELGTK